MRGASYDSLIENPAAVSRAWAGGYEIGKTSRITHVASFWFARWLHVRRSLVSAHRHCVVNQWLA